jgi:hypothetical protein
MLYREIIAVCSEIHTKHINTLCGQNVEFVMLQLRLHTSHCNLRARYSYEVVVVAICSWLRLCVSSLRHLQLTDQHIVWQIWWLVLKWRTARDDDTSVYCWHSANVIWPVVLLAQFYWCTADCVALSQLADSHGTLCGDFWSRSVCKQRTPVIVQGRWVLSPDYRPGWRAVKCVGR